MTTAILPAPTDASELPGGLSPSLLNGMNLPIVVTDPNRADNPIVFVSTTFERMTGYASAECVGRNCRFLQGKNTDPAAVQRMREAIEAGHAETIDILNYRKNGTAFLNRLLMAPLRDGNGALVGFIGVQSEVFAGAPADDLMVRLYRDMGFPRVAMDKLDDVLEDLQGVSDDADPHAQIFAWDIANETLYTPGPRPGVLMDGQSVARSARDYLNSVHPDDLPGLQRQLAAALESPTAEFGHAFRLKANQDAETHEGWRDMEASGRFVYVGESTTPTLLCVVLAV